MEKRNYKHYQKKEVPFDLISYKERVGKIQDEPLRKKGFKRVRKLGLQQKYS